MTVPTLPTWTRRFLGFGALALGAFLGLTSVAMAEEPTFTKDIAPISVTQ